MRKIVLSRESVSGTLSESEMIKDNRILGMMAGNLLVVKLGGSTVGGGNKQIQWISPDNVVYAVGTGTVPQTFIKSSNKGTGRSGVVLKEGDAFLHLSLSKGVVTIQEYSKSQVEGMI